MNFFTLLFALCWAALSFAEPDFKFSSPPRVSNFPARPPVNATPKDVDFNVYQYPYNPILIPSSPAYPINECSNIYSQELVNYYDQETVLLMYYGGWEYPTVCQDQIWFAYSVDGGVNWRKYPNDAKPVPVLTYGSSLHVNDPSIVVTPNTYWMYYTDNWYDNGAYRDHVALAISNNVLNFQKQGDIVTPGPPGSWCEEDVGRPAVIYLNGVFLMWYDGTDSSGVRSVGFANSTDGVHFTPYPGNPLFQNGGGIDVKWVANGPNGGAFYMLQEGGDGATLSVSSDGISWTNQGVVTPKSGQWWDAYGQVVPSFQLSPTGDLQAIWFGGATNAGWDQNVICSSYPDGSNYPVGGGCSMCTDPGISCSETCQDAGVSNLGLCGDPGSHSPSSCCACTWDGCQGCLSGYADCHAACVANGQAGGYCGAPGSTNPSDCCACFI